MSTMRFIDVCVCTYRRASVIDTIASIADQQLPENTKITLIISDNDDTPSAEAIVRQQCTKLGIDLRYVHAPARNISIARNAALDAASASLIAFIDDDEIATPVVAFILGEMSRHHQCHHRFWPGASGLRNRA